MKHIEKWLKCFVTSGMFSDELCITVRSKSEGDVAIFVPEEMVCGSCVPVKITEAGLAILPDEHKTAIDFYKEDLV